MVSWHSPGGQLLSDAQLTASSTDGERRIAETLTDGSALERFKKMIIAQGVDSTKAEELCRKGADIWTVLPKADIVSNVVATESGKLGIHLPLIDLLKNLKVKTKLSCFPYRQ